MVSEDDLQRVTYFAENASQQDWDLNNNLGWGPDYTDPSSYIDITSGKNGENANSYFDSMLVRIMQRQKKLVLMNTIN